jgi:hypothetical protein
MPSRNPAEKNELVKTSADSEKTVVENNILFQKYINHFINY